MTAAKPRPRRLSADVLKEKGKELKAARTASSAAEAEKKRLSAELAAELQRRKMKGLEFEGGGKLTLVEPEVVTYDYDALEELARKKVISLKTLRSVQKRAIDTDAFLRAIETGDIPRDVMAKVTKVEPGVAYVLTPGL
jgi:hypothetical protein